MTNKKIILDNQHRTIAKNLYHPVSDNILRMLAEYDVGYDYELTYHSIRTGLIVGWIIDKIKTENFNDFTYRNDQTDFSLISKNKNIAVTAAFVHDIGKKYFDHKILFKNTSFDKLERLIVEFHPSFGELAINHIKDNISDFLTQGFSASDLSLDLFFKLAKQGITEHHEKIDGSGYPGKLKGAKISLFGRIVAIADLIEALLGRRTYKPAWTPYEVNSFVKENQILPREHFDSNLIDFFNTQVSYLSKENGSKIFLERYSQLIAPAKYILERILRNENKPIG